MAKKAKKKLGNENTVTTGVLRLHPRGFGFVKPEGSTTAREDIFIPKNLTLNAVDGDIVEVLVNTNAVSEKGPEGRIVTILKRVRKELAGTIRDVNKRGEFRAYVPMLGSNQQVIVEVNPATKEAIEIGDRVVLEVLEWGSKDTPTYTILKQKIGHISDPTVDIPAAIAEFELRREFPAGAVADAKNFGSRVAASEIKKREDLRGTTCFTIDPDTAKDFDDAISLHKDHQGFYHLGVHIADVSHYVIPGSDLDIEAQMRCNSTYFPGYCLPMLPKELSDNLCSLKPNVNRLTVSVFMDFDPEGTLVDYRISRTVIKSAKRFTYKEAKAVLDGTTQSPHREALDLMVELCRRLKKKRYDRGSVEFGLPELVVLVNELGIPTGTDYVTYDITHQLVEEFMIKANEVVAQHLSNEGKHLTFRIHDQPSEENLRDFSLMAAAFGFKLSPTPTPREIQVLFDEAMETPYGQHLATSYIRRMRQALYSPDNIGHYGLSLLHYCHFTSPIRRYVDLVAHRLLFQPGEEKEKLEMIAARCSDQERVSAKAEMSVAILKKLRLLNSRKQECPWREYAAVITRVKNFGITFEVVELMFEGYLHVSELESDYYVYDNDHCLLKGRNRGRVYKVGDEITILLKEVDFITQDATWSLLGEESSQEEKKRSNKADHRDFQQPKKQKREKKAHRKKKHGKSKRRR